MFNGDYGNGRAAQASVRPHNDKKGAAAEAGRRPDSSLPGSEALQQGGRGLLETGGGSHV